MTKEPDWQTLFKEQFEGKNRDNVLYFLDRYFLCKWFSHIIKGKDCRLHRHEIVIPTGDFKGNFDYGRGMLLLSVNTYADFSTGGLKWKVGIQFTNIDDGGWDASNGILYEDYVGANKITDKMKDVLDDWFKANQYVLPNEETFNNILRSHGFWGEFTG